MTGGGVCLSFVAFLFRGGQREASSPPYCDTGAAGHGRPASELKKDPSRRLAAKEALKVDSFFKTHRGLEFA